MDVRLNYGKVVVIDLECTCWEGESAPSGEVSEIIEVGVCLLSTQTLEISKPRRIFVTPTQSRISEFCTKLTGITPEMIAEKGKSKKEACDILMTEYGMDKRPWAGWGQDEEAVRREFYLQPNGSYINIAALYGIITSAQRSIGLVDALTACGMEFKGIRHQGGADAYNAGRILRYIIQNARRKDEGQNTPPEPLAVPQIG